jgi:GNAT superfamily N-acetyltransferase
MTAALRIPGKGERMTTQNMLHIAMAQSAEDVGCKAEDFLSERSLVVPLKPGANAKKYYKPPIGCNFISYGNNVVAAAADGFYDVVQAYVERFDFRHCFETPNMYWLNRKLEPLGQTVCFMAEYFLPDIDKLTPLRCPYETRLLEKPDFEELYLPEWSNALCAARKHLDVLAAGAYDGGRLVGLAGCSADAEEMWQIGVDVLPAYRRQGIAAALTSRLATEILARGKVPFYCAAWSNIRSVRNAMKSAFLPAWVEMTVKPIAVVEEMNEEK